MIERISQSFMKDMRDYLRGTKCGNLIEHKWVKGLPLDDATEAMDEGSYFEYILTGALPKDGKVPQPEYMESKIKANIKAGKGPTEGLGVDDMYSEYRYAHQLAEAILGMWEKMGLQIAKDKKGNHIRGQRIQKGRHEGTIDVVLEATRNVDLGGGVVLAKGDRICLDIKYSGLIKERWSRHGWGDGNFTDEQREYHGTQAKQYHYLTGLPFGFMVAGKKKKEADDNGEKTQRIDVRFFFPNITEQHIVDHLADGNDYLEKLQAYAEFGFTPRPSYKVCQVCPLTASCKDKHEYPRFELVEI